MNIYSIYRAVNKVNGKIYIGFDSNWPHRKNSHKCYHKEAKNKFHRAIKKYGWDNFDWEIIYQSKDMLHTLNVMERYFIKQYDSFKNGYNSTLGGEGSFGKKQSEYNRKMLSESRRGAGNTNYGKSASEETRRKRSETLKGRKLSEERKKNISKAKKGKKMTIIDGKKRFI